MSENMSYQAYDPAWGTRTVPEIPDVPLFQLMQQASARNPGKPAVVFLGKSTTYKELDEFSNRVASALIDMGIEKGDRVAVMLPNCTQHIITLYGILKAGGIIVPLNVMLKSEEIKYIVEESEPKAIVTFDLACPGIKPVAQDLGISKIVSVHIGDFAVDTDKIPPQLGGSKELIEGTVDFMDLISTEESKPLQIEINAKKDLAVILYTSGTTGHPKGAMLSHYNFNAGCTQNVAVFGLVEDDVLLSLFPYFHVGGLVLTMFNALSCGAVVVPVLMFNPGDVLDVIETHKVTTLLLPPTGYLGLMNHPEFSKSKVSTLSNTYACGAPLPPVLQRKWQEIVGEYLYNGYGATETSATAPGITEMANKKKMVAGTLGVTFNEIKIVDETGNTAPRGMTGEYYHRGPGICSGYWKKPEETELAFTEDGWWRSGDVGYMDEEGFIYFVERSKDLIVASGYNIAPAEVESCIFNHEAVDDVGVVGIPDEYRGETVKAFVALKKGYQGKVTGDEIIRYCRENIAVYKAPTEVAFVDNIPKNATGKTLRKVLREMHRWICSMTRVMAS